jgi:hypothetical protein
VLLQCVEQRDGLQPVARGARAGLLRHAPGVDRLLHGGDDQLGAELGREAVPVVEHLREVVARVHVHERERERGRPEGLAREVREDDGVLAAAEQEHGALQLRADLADDVDGLGLQRLQVGDGDA